MRTLSVIIPAYNEERFIGRLLEKVLAVDLSEFDLEIEAVVIDDCSSDRTAEIAGAFEAVHLIRRTENGGKGEAVKLGIAEANGDFLIIQDADLEYDPNDYVPMLRALVEKDLDAVYGSRYMPDPERGWLYNFLHGKHAGQSLPAYLGGRSLSIVAFVFTGRYLTDTVTALKLFRRDVIKSLELVTHGFELDHEITSRILAQHKSLEEVPIHYFPRSKGEGKKIGLSDWFEAVRTFARFRKG
ncbi:MAG: glycosyltransferase family 2 protein [Gemmatimonadota bacterium]